MVNTRLGPAARRVFCFYGQGEAISEECDEEWLPVLGPLLSCYAFIFAPVPPRTLCN